MPTSRVTIHMASSVDGFIAARDGRLDWMETADHFEGGQTLTPEAIQKFVDSIDCYLMGSRTYETALAFEDKGAGWAYGDKPVFVLTHRKLPVRRETVQLHATDDLRALVDGTLRASYANIWVVGGAQVAGECLRLGLADELQFSLLPVVIGDGVSFFEGLDQHVRLHLVACTPYDSGIIGVRYEVRKGYGTTD